uniref:Uncharacterized protein n=1 Tax=Cucumis melo TaxID=3656 RepID=A0A9I9EES4_CUCME
MVNPKELESFKELGRGKFGEMLTVKEMGARRLEVMLGVQDIEKTSKDKALSSQNQATKRLGKNACRRDELVTMLKEVSNAVSKNAWAFCWGLERKLGLLVNFKERKISHKLKNMTNMKVPSSVTPLTHLLLGFDPHFFKVVFADALERQKNFEYEANGLMMLLGDLRSIWLKSRRFYPFAWSSPTI